jgi:endonuclease YncB( thermonuclease family)
MDSNLDLCKILKNCDKKTKKFTLEGKTKLCKVVSVYDGDTCNVVFDHNGVINRWNVRMNGYDTPEMRPSKSLLNRDEIKKKAIASRDYLKSLVYNEEQLVYIKCGGFDKYGRLLGDIYINENDTESVNCLMVKNGHGYEYFGGKKKVQ